VDKNKHLDELYLKFECGMHFTDII